MFPYDLKTLRDRYRWFRETAPYARQPRRTTFDFAWWAIREMATEELAFRTSDGVRMVSMPGNFSSMAMYLLSDRDPEIQSVIRRVVPAGGVFVDVGANIGSYTVRASQIVGPAGRVVAIEAHPFTFGFLERTIALNGFANVTAMNIAAGAGRQIVRMKYTAVNPGETHVSREGDAEIMMQPLDECMAGLGIAAIDYLKIDVEGYELFVLRGARRIIEPSRGIVVQTEQVDQHARRYGHSVSEIVELLLAYGLQPHRVDKEGAVHAVPERERYRDGDYLWAFRSLC
jgi:FkbM family methyltransferase